MTKIRLVLVGVLLAALTAAPAIAQESRPANNIGAFKLTAPDFLAAAGTPAARAAQAPAAAPADPGYVTFFKSTELGGLVDAYYAFNSNKVAPLYRAFDVADNAFSVSMAELWLAKTPDKDSPVGFKIKLNFGPSASTIINFAEPNKDLANVEEGFVSYMAPVGKGLQIDFGKFVTNAGAEVIEAKDNWNYSRSLLFQNTIPYYHAGVRATYAASDMVTIMVGVVNGWNNVNENNRAKTVMASITLKPTMALSIIENYIGGNEKPTGTGTEWRHLSDTVLAYTVNSKVSVLGNLDYTRESFATAGGPDAHLLGIAGYVKLQATSVVAIVPRVEYLDDAQGLLAGGTAQKLKSATLTIELKPADNFMWRIEYRGDFSDKSTFADDTGAPKANQHSVIFGLLYSFTTK